MHFDHLFHHVLHVEPIQSFQRGIDLDDLPQGASVTGGGAGRKAIRLIHGVHGFRQRVGHLSGRRNILPGLQLKYGVGIFDSLATITLRYRLMPRLYLEAASGVNQAFDVLYSFEY